MKNAVERFVRLAVEWLSTEDAKAERVALWGSFSPSERQQTEESRTFISFANAMKLVSDPFEHFNGSPPKPDISALIDGKNYYFELGEITDQGLARSINIAQKMKEVSGCALSQVDPL